MYNNLDLYFKNILSLSIHKYNILIYFMIANIYLVEIHI